MPAYERGEKWCVKVSVLGRQEWVGTFRNRREANRAEVQYLAGRLAGAGSGSDQSCKEYGDWWLANRKRSAPATTRTYGYAIKRFIRDFGEQRLDSITKPVAKSWANRTPHGVVKPVRTMFADAVREGTLDSNPFSGLRLEAPRGRKDLQALTEDEIDQLARCALDSHIDAGPTIQTMILTMAYVGLRPGETFALKRSDFSESFERVTVSRSLDGTGSVKAPKNGKTRVVSVPPRAREALLRHPIPKDAEWFFRTPRGNRFNKSSFTRYFGFARSRFGRPDIAPHELRHACATMLVRKKVPVEAVAKQLGHQDGGRLVQDLYAHYEEEWAIEEISRAFNAELDDVIASPRAGNE